MILFIQRNICCFKKFIVKRLWIKNIAESVDAWLSNFTFSIRNVWLFSTYLISMCWCFDKDYLWLGFVGSPCLNIWRLISKNTQIKLKCWFVTQVEDQRWPYLLFSIISQFGDHNLVFQILLDQPFHRNNCFNLIRHQFSHLFQLCFVSKIGQVFTYLIFDAVSFIMSLLLLTFDSVLVLRWKWGPCSSNFEEHADAIVVWFLVG